jgi:hypothetical protein
MHKLIWRIRNVLGSMKTEIIIVDGLKSHFPLPLTETMTERKFELLCHLHSAAARQVTSAQTGATPTPDDKAAQWI